MRYVSEKNRIYLAGQGDLLITAANGNRLGYVNGELVNEIEGAEYIPQTSADFFREDMEPVYSIPNNIAFTMSLTGAPMESGENSESAITMLGQGFALAIKEIVLDPDQTDSIEFSEDGSRRSYQTFDDESPVLTF